VSYCPTWRSPPLRTAGLGSASVQGRTTPPRLKPTPDTTQAVLPIDQIIIGDRTVGLLNPITVDENGRLLAGARRLAACKRRERPLRGRR
jgi:hypothetical protein